MTTYFVLGLYFFITKSLCYIYQNYYCYITVKSIKVQFTVNYTHYQSFICSCQFGHYVRDVSANKIGNLIKIFTLLELVWQVLCQPDTINDKMMHKGNVLQMITTLFRNQNIVSSKKKHFTSNVTHFSQHFNLIISCDKCRPWITCLSTTITSCDIYTQNRIQKNNMDTRIVF